MKLNQNVLLVFTEYNNPQNDNNGMTTVSRTESRRIRAAYQLPEAKQLKRRNRQIKDIRETKTRKKREQN